MLEGGNCWGSFGKLTDVVRPIRFRACADRTNALDPVANSRATIRVHGAFHRSFVVVNEQSRGRDRLQTLSELFELQPNTRKA